MGWIAPTGVLRFNSAVQELKTFGLIYIIVGISSGYTYYTELT